MAFVLIDSRIIWQPIYINDGQVTPKSRYLLPCIEHPNCGDQNVKSLFLGISRFEVFDLKHPFRCFGIPSRTHNPLLKLDILVHIILLCYILPVLADFSTLGVFLTPLRIGCESGLIYVSGNVTTNSRVDVF